MSTSRASGRTTVLRIVPEAPVDTSANALAALLKRLKATVDPMEIRQLSDQIERLIFHKQFKNA